MATNQAWWSDIPDEMADAIFRIQVTIQGKGDFSKDLRPDLAIHDAILDEQLALSPSAIYWWNAIQANAKAAAEILERSCIVRRAKVRQTLVEKMLSEGLKMTDKTLESIVESDSEVNRLEAEKIAAWSLSNRLIGLTKSLQARNDNLRSLIGQKKRERDTTS